MMHSRQAKVKQSKDSLRPGMAMLVVAGLMSVAATGWAQLPAGNSAALAPSHSASAQPSASKAIALEEQEEAAGARKPGDEGIRIHGHWVLVVKNPDGKQVERREFDNSLVTTGSFVTGSQILATLLSGNGSVTGPSVAFIQLGAGANVSDLSSFCPNSLSFPPSNIGCYILQSPQSSSSFLSTGNGGSGLNTTVTFTPVVSIVLNGNFTVPSGLTSVSMVQTIYGMCIPNNASFNTGSFDHPQLTGSATFYNITASSNACVNTLPSNIFYVAGTLTSTYVTAGSSSVATPLAVTQGQIITVTVTLSFS